MTDSVSIRLTPNQMSVIWPGLDFIVKAYVARRDKKTALFAYPFGVYPPPPGFNRGTYDAAMMDQVTRSWKRLRLKTGAGGRVQMNAIEIRAVIFGVRVTLGLIRIQRNNARRGKWDAATKQRMQLDQRSLDLLRRNSKRTIASLERHLKRANRLLQNLASREGYKALVGVWQQHLRWMRLHLAYFKPLTPIVRSKQRHQRNLEILMEMAVGGLRNQGYEPPAAPDLRRIMRLFTHSAARGRQSVYTIPEMIGHPNSFTHRWYLARFVMARAKLKPLT